MKGAHEARCCHLQARGTEELVNALAEQRPLLGAGSQGIQRFLGKLALQSEGDALPRVNHPLEESYTSAWHSDQGSVSLTQITQPGSAWTTRTRALPSPLRLSVTCRQTLVAAVVPICTVTEDRQTDPRNGPFPAILPHDGNKLKKREPRAGIHHRLATPILLPPVRHRAPRSAHCFPIKKSRKRGNGASTW